MPFINFAELKAAIPIEDAARALRLKLTPDGDGFRSPCPACKSDNLRAIKVTPGKGFYCHSGGQEASGSVIDLVKHVKGYKTLGEAAQFLLEEFGTVDSTVPSDSNSTVSKERATVPQEQRREPTRPPKKETAFDPEAFREAQVRGRSGSIGLLSRGCRALRYRLLPRPGLLPGPTSERLDQRLYRRDPETGEPQIPAQVAGTHANQRSALAETQCMTLGSRYGGGFPFAPSGRNKDFYQWPAWSDQRRAQPCRA